MILGIFSGFNQIGGIQRIARHTAVVLSEIASTYKEPCNLIGLNDSAGRSSFTLETREYEVRGFGCMKWRLIAYVLRRTFKTRVLYLGHCRFATLGLIMKLFNPRLCYWIATYGVEIWQPLPFLYRLSMNKACGITALSRDTAEHLAASQGTDDSKISIIPPALDPAFMTLKPNDRCLIFPPGEKIILTVARLVMSEPGKGVDTVIRALPDVLKRIPDLFYAVVGEGDHLPYLKSLAEELGVGERVYFAGKKEGMELNKYYSTSDIFVMPSCQEGFGIVFLEALSFGKPVIGADYGGTPDVVIDGITGFLVDFNDTEALVDRLIHLFSNEELREKMGKAGKRLVMEKYTFDHFRKRLAAVLLK